MGSEVGRVRLNQGLILEFRPTKSMLWIHAQEWRKCPTIRIGNPNPISNPKSRSCFEIGSFMINRVQIPASGFILFCFGLLAFERIWFGGQERPSQSSWSIYRHPEVYKRWVLSHIEWRVDDGGTTSLSLEGTDQVVVTRISASADCLNPCRVVNVRDYSEERGILSFWIPKSLSSSSVICIQSSLTGATRSI